MRRGRTCKKCEFWESEGGSDKGWCRRFPPTKEGVYGWSWPETDALHWCGEFNLSTPQPNVDEGDA